MSFYEQLRTPSWKGFEFALSTDNKDFGRDVKRHKKINGKSVDHEDTGQKPIPFVVEAVIGGSDDFVEQAAEFEALLSEEGVGRLVLPHEGEITAVVMTARRRHNSDEVGIIYFSITFEEVDTTTVAPAGISSTYNLIKAVDNSNEAALLDFSDEYNDGMPDFITDKIQSQMDDFKGVLNGNLNRVNKVIGFGKLEVSKGITFGKKVISTFENIVSFGQNIDLSIAFDNSDNIDEIDFINMVNALNDTADMPAIYYNDDKSSSSTNIKTTDLFSRITTINAAAKASLSAEYESQKQAIEVRDSLFSTISNLRNEAGAARWSESYISLGSLMAAINRDIDNRLGRLPITAVVKTQAMRSSLAIAHRIFGDNPNTVIAQADDLIKRNSLVHPAFITARELEVLSEL